MSFEKNSLKTFFNNKQLAKCDKISNFCPKIFAWLIHLSNLQKNSVMKFKFLFFWSTHTHTHIVSIEGGTRETVKQTTWKRRWFILITLLFKPHRTRRKRFDVFPITLNDDTTQSTDNFSSDIDWRNIQIYIYPSPPSEYEKKVVLNAHLMNRKRVLLIWTSI